MVREKYFVSENYKDANIALLIDNLPSLRARIGISQEELASVLGVSRQTYYSLETGKREMSWAIFLAIVFIFDSVKETSEMIQALKIFPFGLFEQLNGNTEGLKIEQ